MVQKLIIIAYDFHLPSLEGGRLVGVVHHADSRLGGAKLPTYACC